MVKRRQPTSTRSEPTPEQIDAFANGVDGEVSEPAQTSPSPDPHAKRDFKAIRVPFNEFEYSRLEEVANKTGRTKLNVIRWAILRLAEETPN